MIHEINQVKEICKAEAEKNPVEGNLYEAGKQMAYSRIYFELMKIPQKEDKNLLLIGIISAICGVEFSIIIIMYFNL